MPKRKPAKDEPFEHKQLTTLVHSAFEKHASKIAKRAHGKKGLEFAIESEILAFDNEAEHARIVVERTKDGAKVPKGYDLDYTVRVEYTDMGIVLSITRTLNGGMFPDMYVRHASFVPVESMITDAVFDRAHKVLKAAKISSYKPEIDDHEDGPMLDGEMDIVPDDSPGPDDLVDLVAEETTKKKKDNK